MTIHKSLTLFAIVALILGLVSACQQAEPTDIPQPEPAVGVEPAEAKEPATAEEPTSSNVEEQTLILATTTSTENSGLLAAILADFESAYSVKVDVVAVGTGQALQLGMDGNADVLLVHARAREDTFMADGHGTRREDVMYNDFVIVGPADDPAGIRGKNRASRAFELIAEAQSPFVSRGDDSGTHTKEKAIWSEAGIEPAGDWYISAGQGMGAVLTMADEQQAYTLSDRATYLARTLEGINLEILVEGDPLLFNPYGVMTVNPEKSDLIKADLANTFIDWLVSVDTQSMIADFGVAEFGTPLFTPDSGPWREKNGASESESEATDDAALHITGMVKNEQAWTEDEIRSMETMDTEYTNKSGEMETYTGVSLNALLELAEVKTKATTLVFVADDGYTAELPVVEAQACADCIVAFRNNGGFSTVMPEFPSNLRVKGVIEIQVK